MKIYGRTLSDVFNDLPWSYRIMVVVGAVFLIFVVVYVPWKIFAGSKKPVLPTAVSGLSTGNAGVLDPSLAFDPATQTAWMAYASESPPDANIAESMPMVGVRLASARAPECATWISMSPDIGFPGKPDDLLTSDGKSIFRSGVWRVETPSIVYDPQDRGREWKLFAYKYFWPKDPRYALEIAQHFGTIVYKYSSNPSRGWSQEQWLFASRPGYPPPPYEQMILLHLNRLHKNLNDVVAYSRPSAIVQAGALFMTLSAFTGGDTPDRIIMIVSRDHGKSWLYLGAPLRLSDIRALGPFTRLSGASLIMHDNKAYLSVVPGDGQQYGGGALIFEFADLQHGILKRDAKTGLPVIMNQIPLNGERTGVLGGGALAYIKECQGGVFMSEQSVAPRSFQIFQTYKPLVGK